jgi:ubiquinol oxidase
VAIDLTKHHNPATLGDKVARWTVKSLRWPVDLFFQVTLRFPHFCIVSEMK